MDNKKEQFIAVIFSVVGSLAILVNLAIKGFTTENILDAVKDLVGLLVTVAVFLIAYSLSNKSKSYMDVARNALKRIQQKMPNFLMGPRYNRENYDPEKGQGIEYLFITNKNTKYKQRAKFIPIQPFEEGVLTFYVQKATLVYGLNYKSEDATEEEIKKIQRAIYDKIFELIQNRYKGMYEVLPNSKRDTAIIIDFDENKMGKKKYAKAITECTEAVIMKLHTLI